MDLATVDKLLTTTRSVRKRLDFSRPVEPEVVERCIEIALQAPTASNRQHWRFVVVTDADKRAAIAEYYHKSFTAYAAAGGPLRGYAEDDPRLKQAAKVRDSATYLAENMHRVPVLVIPCNEGRVENAPLSAQAALFGSILPATWSFMLALRARGLGSAWTTLHLVYAREVGELLGIPDTFTQAALLPVAYYTGDDFQPAARVPATQLTYWNTWDTPRA